MGPIPAPVVAAGTKPAPPSVPADDHNETLRTATAKAEKLEPRLAALLEPILARAGARAASAFEAKVTDHLAAALAAAAAAPDVTSTSTMVCVKPRPEEAAALAYAGGLPAENLHVTLAYLGKLEGDLGAVAEALRPVAASYAPLAGVVGGAGLFTAGPDGAGPSILLPDVPGLVETRVAATEALAGAGIDYGREHGFEAHVTVAYYGPDAPAEDDGYLERVLGGPLHFDALLVVRGDVVEYELPLVGVPPLTAAGPPPWTPPAGDELIDVDALVGEIRAKTDPVRQAMIEATMTPALRQAGLSFDVTNPLTAKALASSAAKVTNIADTTRLNLMRIIGASHAAGLSIPQTADAIRAGMATAGASRATMIARTEMAQAVNGGSLAATQLVSQATGDGYSKKWLTAPGAPHPRHELYDGLDGQTQPLDQPFDVGGSPMMYPADPDGDPGESINCRCAMSYDSASGEQMADAENTPEIGAIASDMVDEAAAAEPEMTAALSGIASQARGRMAGLEFAVKTQDSLERKIAGDLAAARAVGKDTSAAVVAAKINDTLRYTMTFPTARYGSGVEDAASRLESAGYRQVKMKNYWGNADYQGINAVYEKDGTRFELQFHTPRTFELKTELHAQYEALRVSTDPLERQRLWNEMAAEQAKNAVPPGALSLGQLVAHEPPSG